MRSNISSEESPSFPSLKANFDINNPPEFEMKVIIEIRIMARLLSLREFIFKCNVKGVFLIIF